MKPGWLLSAGLLTLALPQGAPAREPGQTEAAQEAASDAIARRARDLYVWGYPLVQAARIRLVSTRGTQPDPVRLTAPIHQFAHGRKLADPDMRIGVGPNNDTLYSLIWMDLAQGPFVFEAPDFGGRYYTFSLNAADSSSSDSLGRRTHGGKLPPLFIHGVGYRGAVPEGMVDVASPTRYFELAGRTLTTGTSADYAVVHRLQDAMKLRRYADWRKGRDVAAPVTAQRPLDDPARAVADDLRFLEELGQVLRDWWPRPGDAALLAQAKALGIGPDGFDPARLGSRLRKKAAKGLADGAALVERQSRQLGVQANGWTTNYSGARFGTDYLLRAAVAKDQIYVAVPEEAIYPIGRVDASDAPLDGQGTYRITMPAAALPPVDAFWSITLYDDNGFMVANPARRYSVGDRTPQLVRRADGSVVIAIGASAPADKDVNWLPAPAEGPFYLMMRLYQPRAAVLDRRWSPPPIVRTDKTKGE
ncbi:DUF1254 domain-containing protein [Novosphingobium resinovorum]|uniref:DUF1254 domain-containing protein n=1 Tax=Novosphingobium resinovorum TaxID=158500 RepID=UPI003619A972